MWRHVIMVIGFVLSIIGGVIISAAIFVSSNGLQLFPNEAYSRGLNVSLAMGAIGGLIIWMLSHWCITQIWTAASKRRSIRIAA